MKKKKVNNAPVAPVAPVAAPVVEEPQKVVVNCPKCSALLYVKSGNFAHLCPVCSQVFRIRTGHKVVRDISRKTMMEAYINVDKDDKGVVNTQSVVNKLED